MAIIVSAREFRDKQKSYLDKVDAGVDILIQRGKNKSYKVTQILEDDSVFTKEEFKAKIERSISEIEKGQGTVIEDRASLMQYLEGL